MKAIRSFLVAALCFCALSGEALAQADGFDIAKKWCAGCHVIGPEEGKTASDAAPSFYEIAQLKTTTVPALTAFLSTPHALMPDYSLTRQEIRDVSDYILSLKK